MYMQYLPMGILSGKLYSVSEDWNVASRLSSVTSTPSPFLGAMAENDLPTTSGKEKAISGMTGTMLIPWQMQSLSLLPIRMICTTKTMGKNPAKAYLKNIRDYDSILPLIMPL